MKKSVYLFLILPFILFLISCEKSDDSILNETIYIRHKGSDMPAFVHGNAEENTFVVVIHGAGSFGLSFRDGAIRERLEQENVVVYFDQRGQSMSQGNYEEPEDLISLMATDVNALLKVLRYRYGEDIKIFLLGHSWGGLLSGSFLLLDGVQQGINGWINVDGLLDTPSASFYRFGLINEIADEQIKADNELDKWESIKSDLSELDPFEDKDYVEILKIAQRTIRLLNSTNVVHQGTSTETLYQTIVVNNPIHWQVSHFFNQPVQVAIEQDYSILDELKRITVPALFLYGKYDVSVPPQMGRDALELLGTTDKKFILFKRSIHHPHDTEDDLFVDEVQKFIEVYK